MWQNDDVGGGSLRSRIIPGRSGAGRIILGSWTHSTRGRCDLCNHYMSYLDNPSTTPRQKKKIQITDNMFKLEIPEPAVDKRFREAYNKYSKILDAEKERIKSLPLEARIEEMKKIESKKAKIFAGLVPE